MPTQSLEIESLPNLGPKSGQWLREAGVCTIADVRRAGPVVAYRRVKRIQLQASLNLLWALAAGLRGEHWRDLPATPRNCCAGSLNRTDPHCLTPWRRPTIVRQCEGSLANHPRVSSGGAQPFGSSRSR